MIFMFLINVYCEKQDNIFERFFEFGDNMFTDKKHYAIIKLPKR